RDVIPGQFFLLPVVASYDRDRLVREVPWTQLDPEGHPPGLPRVVLLPGPDVPVVQFHAHPFAELEEQPLGLEEHLLLAALLEERHDDGLDGSRRGREDEALRRPAPRNARR